MVLETHWNDTASHVPQLHSDRLGNDKGHCRQAVGNQGFLSSGKYDKGGGAYSHVHGHFDKKNYSAFTNFTEWFFTNIIVTVCHSHMGFSPLTLESLCIRLCQDGVCGIQLGNTLPKK